MAKKIEEQKPTPAWWKIGLAWGFFMYVFNALLYPFFAKLEITAESLIMAIPVWGIAGLVFGFIVHLLTRKARKKQNQK